MAQEAGEGFDQKIWQHLPVAARAAFARVVGIAVTSEYERRAR
jgi:hypothetical protein